MIAKQSYEKRKGPFLINMWEVDFPCKAGLLRRKVCVCPLCTDGPVECRPASAGGFVCTWDISDGLCREGLLTALQVQRDMWRKKDGIVRSVYVCVSVFVRVSASACLYMKSTLLAFVSVNKFI